MKHTKAVLLTCLVALVWSLAGFNIKVIDWAPLSITGGRSLIAAILMGPFIIRKDMLRINGPIILCALSYVVFNYSFILSTKLTTSAYAIMMQYTAPVYIVLFSWLVWHEKVSLNDIICIIFVAIGMGFFFSDSSITGSLFGKIIAILNGISFASISICFKLQKVNNPVVSIFWGNVFTAVIGIPFITTSGIPDMQSMLFLLLAGVIAAASYTTYAYVSTNLSALETVLIPIIDPVMNPVWVCLMLGEIPGIRTIIGACVILIAVIIRNVRHHGQVNNINQQTS